jgi:hypothetical protein
VPNTTRSQRSKKSIPAFRLEELESRHCPANISWIGGVNSDGLWSTPANWNLNRRPEAGDTIVFNPGSNHPDSTADIQAGLWDTIKISGGYNGSLTIPTTFAVNHLVIDTSGGINIKGAGSFVVEALGDWTWTGGQGKISIPVTIEDAAKATLTGGGMERQWCQLSNATITNLGSLFLENNTTVSLDSASVDNESGSVARTDSDITSTDPHINFIGTGSFTCKPGSTFIYQAGIAFNPGVTLTMQQCTVTDDFGPSSLYAKGLSNWDGITFDPSGEADIFLQNTSFVKDLTIGAEGKLVVAGPMSLSGTNVIRGTYVQQGAGSVAAGQGVPTLQLNGTSNVDSGGFWSGINITIGAAGKLRWGSPPEDLGQAQFGTSGTSITNNGQITLKEQNFSFGSNNAGVFSSLTNSATGTINVSSDVTFTTTLNNMAGAPAFSNAGTVQVGDAANARQFNVQFPVTNSGTVTINGKSQFTVSNDANFPLRTSDYTQSFQGVTTIAEGGTLQASGNVSIGGKLSVLGKGGTVKGKTVSNGAALTPATFSLEAPDTVLTVTGDYAQFGTLKIVVATGNKTGLVAVSGNATVGGIVDATAKDKLVATDTFLFLSSNKRTGMYADPILHNFTDYENKYSDTTVTLVPKTACANDDAATVKEDASVAINVLDNDTAPNSFPLSIASYEQATNGTVSVDPATGYLVYTPNPDWNGVDTFSYTISDGDGSTDPIRANVTVTVSEVNDRPVAVNDTLVASNEDTVRSIGSMELTANDSAGPSNESGQMITIVAVSNPVGGSVSLSSGVITFTPAANYNGPAGFDYTIQDNGTTAGAADPLTAIGHVAFTINAVNDAPSFTAGSNQTVSENAGYQTVIGWATALSAGPSDEAGQSLVFLVSNSNAALFSTPPSINNQGTLTYAPATNAYGVATVTVYVQDDGGTANGGVNSSPAQTFTITVDHVNRPPVALDDAGMAPNNGMPVMFMVLSNDSDPDGDILRVTSVTQPAHGTVSIDPMMSTTVQYVSDQSGFTGTVTFNYTISDGHGGAATATVSVYLNGIAPPPPPLSPPPPFSPPPPYSPPPPPSPPAGYGVVSGFLWNDANHNGIQDSMETGFGTSVEIELIDSNGNVAATTWTMGGMFSFSMIANDVYHMHIVAPTGYVFSPENRNPGGLECHVNSNGDSDDFEISGMTCINLNAGLY